MARVEPISDPEPEVVIRPKSIEKTYEACKRLEQAGALEKRIFMSSKMMNLLDIMQKTELPYTFDSLTSGRAKSAKIIELKKSRELLEPAYNLGLNYTSDYFAPKVNKEQKKVSYQTNAGQY